jgi:hypothetical protein
MLFAGGNAQEPVAVTEVFIRKTAFFRTKEKGDAAAGEMFAQESRGLLEAANRVLRLAAADRGGPDNERAIRHSFRDGLKFFGAGEQWGGADGGARFAKCQFIRIHDAKMEEAEVAHGASGGANVERIARLDENDAQVVELGKGRQGSEFTAEEKQ